MGSFYRHDGFTLIELLISISILAIVFGAVIASTTKIQQSGRNTKRESDLRIIQSALQQYYSDHNYFPSTISFGFALDGCTGGDSTSCSSLGTKSYMAKVPNDPSSGINYCYVAFPDATSATTCTDNSVARCYYYRLYAKLEGAATNPYSVCSSAYTVERTPN